jgi:hypothetical protein
MSFYDKLIYGIKCYSKCPIKDVCRILILAIYNVIAECPDNFYHVAWVCYTA